MEKLFQLIVYACPVGPLAEQIEIYLNKSRSLCGANKAHSYMPHCSLTGFFHDDADQAHYYVERLEDCYQRYWNSRNHNRICVTGMEFKADWHGLLLDAPKLQQLIQQFAESSVTPTRQEKIRPKSWLHLSLAYGFHENQSKRLESLAQALIHLRQEVNWQLRFYRRDPGNGWLCYHQWEL
jgi:hypothetical protein